MDLPNLITGVPYWLEFVVWVCIACTTLVAVYQCFQSWKTYQKAALQTTHMDKVNKEYAKQQDLQAALEEKEKSLVNMIKDINSSCECGEKMPRTARFCRRCGKFKS